MHLAGFVVQAPPVRPPGYIARPGQEIVGFDFRCSGSVLEGDICALPTGLGAVLVCARLPECQAVVVYPQGELPLAVVSCSMHGCGCVTWRR